MSKFKIIFVHGYTATPEADWYPAITPLLKAADIDFSIPALPGDEYPRAAEWLEILDHEVRASVKPVMLVGHSLGTRTVLLYLEQAEIEVEAVLLIAAPSNDPANGLRQDEHYEDFYEYKINLEQVKAKSKHGFTVLHGTDDSDVPFTQGESLATELGATLIGSDHRDHFCAPENAEIIFETISKISSNFD